MRCILIFLVWTCLWGCAEPMDVSPDSSAESDTTWDFHLDSETTDPLDSAARPVNGPDTETTEFDMIDDMEDQSGYIFQTNGRIGVWYVFNDETGAQWPPLTSPGEPASTAEILGGRGASRRAMHTYGDGFHDWGAGIGIDLCFDGITYQSVDASMYDGLTFWARSSIENSVLLRFGDKETVSIDWGGNCPKWECDVFEYGIDLESAWKQFWVFFDDIYLDADSVRSLMNIQFAELREGSDWKDVTSFDYWIDDVAFFSGAPDCNDPETTCVPFRGTVDIDTSPPIL